MAFMSVCAQFSAGGSKISFEIGLIPSHPQSSSGRIIFGRNLSTEAKKGKSHLVISLGPSFRPPSVLRSGSRGCQLPVSIWIILWWGKQRVHAGSIWGSGPGEKLFLVGFGVIGICENWWGGVKISWVPLPHVLSICFFSSSRLPGGLLAEKLRAWPGSEAAGA